MSITLPPLPERPWRMFCTKCGRTTPLDAKDVQHSPPGSPFVSHFGVCPCGYQALAEQAPWTADQLRARDLEVARLVLEAAAKEVHGCAHRIMADLLDVDSHRRVLATEQRIRELEVSHDA